ncbi:MAG: Fpg/Nei family DNA glycosylase [Sulfurifustis sp.]
MPELPDVEILRRRFAAQGVGHRIDAVGVQTPRILAGISAREFSARLIGRKFRRAQRHGKRLYCMLDRGGWVSFHFGLTGGLEFYRDPHPQPRFARVVLDFAAGRRLAYVNRRMIGRIEWVDDMAADIAARKLGPDALDRGFTAAAFKGALAGRRGTIKSVLMDQSVMAGIGNEYSDEILFQCRLHPLTPLATLGDRERAALYRTLRVVLKRAVECGAEPERLPRNFLIPHRRAGETCPRCGGLIKRIAVEGRGTYFCPRCQAKPRATPTRRVAPSARVSARAQSGGRG